MGCANQGGRTAAVLLQFRAAHNEVGAGGADADALGRRKYTGVVGEVLEFEPPHRYVTTFKFTAYDDPPCKVTHELREVERGVEYTLISETLAAGTKTRKQMKQGGDFIVKTLKACVETGRPPLKSRLILAMIGLTEWMTPKRCLSENWPFDKTIE